LKEREADYKRVSHLSQKANQTEVAAEAAADDAHAKVKSAQEDLDAKKLQAQEANETGKEAAAVMASAQAVFDEAEKEASLAVANHQLAENNLKDAHEAAEATTVTRLEEIAEAAQKEEKVAVAEEKRLVELAEAAKEAMDKAADERDATKAAAAEKHEHAEKLAERENEADAKEEVVDGLITELEAKVHALAVATFESRMGAPAFWTYEEGEATAEASRESRREAANHDARAVATASRDRHLELSVVDKWLLFRKMTAENSSSADTWNVKKIFHKDGGVISGISIMVADILGSALDRGPPDPMQCVVSGAGLNSATICQVATFDIFALSSHGIRFEDGGDTFNVSIRFVGQCTRVPAKIVDNDNGSYTVSYKPRNTGYCTISVTLLGEPLPGSPYSCVVAGREGPAPCAQQCIVSGDALSTVTAHSSSQFSISFRDAHGNLAHASDLDVWVQPTSSPIAEPDSESQGSQVAEVVQLLTPPGAFESFVVGATALEVTRTPDIGSLCVGRLAPGRTLKLGKIEAPLADGTVRACVKLELEDIEPKDSSTWRQLWPAQQPWRSLSWRAHRIAEATREDEEAEHVAMSYAIHLQDKRIGAAQCIEAAFRGKQARRNTSRLVQKKNAALAAAAAAEAAKAAGIMESAAAAAARKKGAADDKSRRGGGNSRGGTKKEAPAGKKKAPAEAAPASAPAPAASKPKEKEPKEKEPKEKEPKEKKASEAKSPGRAELEVEAPKETPKPKAVSPKPKKQKKKSLTAADIEADEAATAVKKAEGEAKAATRIQAVARGTAARKAFAVLKADAAKASSQGSKKKKGTKKGSKHTPNESRRAPAGPSPSQRVATESNRSPVSKPQNAVAAAIVAAADTAALERVRALAIAPQFRVPSPRLNLSKPQEQMYGWVTLAAGNEVYVVKQTGRLPVRLRQKHEEEWTRRNAIDSERELARAKQRDHDMIESKIPKLSTAMIPHDHPNPSIVSARPAYWDEIAADPKRIGFAYGGIYPGRLHAKGQLVDKHDVHFSIGVCGSYLLYVNLRKPHTPWAAASGQSPRGNADDWQVAGSPFLLRVLPGKAYPLATKLPADKLPLRGGPDQEGSSKIYSAELTVQTRDKMGNPCDSGDAPITVGFFDSITERHNSSTMSWGSASERPSSIDASDAKAEPTGESAPAPAAAPSTGIPGTRTATCTDQGNGAYHMRWQTTHPGQFDIYVKIDGLHVLGSPSKMVLSENAQFIQRRESMTSAGCAPAASPAAQVSPAASPAAQVREHPRRVSRE